MKKFALLLAILAGLGAASAGAYTETELEVLGFSADGAFLAYQVSGYGTGSGIGFSMVQIVDVASNVFATDDFVVRETLGEACLEGLKDAVLSRARTALAGFGIVAGNTGGLVYELRARTPWEELIRKRKSVRLELEDAPAPPLRCELLLEEREVAADYCANLDAYDLVPRIFTLSLRGAGFDRVLQEDRVLYRSRHCPYAYEFYRVYVYGDRLAVFLNARSVGWEGDDVYKLVVTGVLDRG